MNRFIARAIRIFKKQKDSAVIETKIDLLEQDSRQVAAGFVSYECQRTHMWGEMDFSTNKPELLYDIPDDFMQLLADMLAARGLMLRTVNGYHCYTFREYKAPEPKVLLPEAA